MNEAAYKGPIAQAVEASNMTDASDHAFSRTAISLGLWRPCLTLMRREVVRFFRERSRIIGALGTPLIFWVLAGSGLGKSFNPGGSMSGGYAEYTFPGALAAILLFTSIFSMISIIDDRRDGFLQGVLVSPAPRAAIVLGKVLGATALAVGEGALFLTLTPLAGIPFGAGSIIITIAAMTLVAIGVTSLGFWIAWKMESTQGFHAIMNLALMPMLVLSGAFFPASSAAKWMRVVMVVNPMTYCVTLLREALYWHAPARPITHQPGGLLALTVTAVFAIVMFTGATRAATTDSARTAV